MSAAAVPRHGLDRAALRALPQAPLSARWPHLAALVGHLSDDDPEIRALAASGLAGAVGTGAFAALVGALDDPDAAVRAAAVAALRTSCAADPGRWVHAAFHPRPDVRRMAACAAPLPGTEDFGLYLMADPDVGELWPVSVGAGSVTVLLARSADGSVGRAAVRTLLLDVPWADVGGLGRPEWCAVLEHFWDADATHDERRSLFGALALRSDPAWFEAARTVAAARGTWVPAAVEAAVIRWPALLGDLTLPQEHRRAGARALLWLTPKPLDPADVVPLAMKVWEERDPETLAGALTVAVFPARVLRAVVSTHELLDGFASDPDGYAPLLALGRTLDAWLRRRLGPALTPLLAGLLERLPPTRCGVFRRLGELGMAVYDEMLARSAPTSPTVAVAARLLVHTLPVRELLERWIAAPDPERIGIGVEVDHVARLVHPEIVEEVRDQLTPRERRRWERVLAWHPRGPGADRPVPAAFATEVLGPREMARIATAPEPPLPHAPSRGLAAALAVRSSLGHPEGVALLGCRDPAPIVVRALDRALGTDPVALSRFDALARATWRGGDLPGIGHAWLSEDDAHAEALCDGFLRDARGFAHALAEMLAMPRVAGRVRNAVLRVLARWEDEEPQRFAAAMTPGVGELLRSRPVSADPVLPDAAARWLSEDALTESALLAGPAVVNEAHLLPLLETRQARERLLQEGHDEDVARKLAHELTSTAARGEIAHRLASVFTWGVRMGELLRGQRFTFHLLGDSALGFTRLGTTEIHVSPMAFLRGHRGGRDLLEGLILHEIGHHVYHTGTANLAVWAQAEAEGIGPLLNLVADEHLERRLRAQDPRFGDRFKRLAAHAFQHGARDLDSRWLLRVLGPSAAAVLANVRLEVSRKPGHVRVRSGSLLQAIGRGGAPFGVFVRALRTGRGTRDGIPAVDEALGPFGPSFKDLDMPGLLEVARALARRFGSCVSLAQCIGGHELDSVSSRDLLAAGGGVTDADVQRELHRIRGIPPPTPQPRRSGTGASVLNVGNGAPVGRLTVRPVVVDPGKHAAAARAVGPALGWLRAQLEHLEPSRERVRGRTVGRRIDRTRLLALATRGEPRVRVGSEVALDDDVFIGVIIDCSGSMSGARMARAVSFGVLVAEAARGLQAIDVHLFGFDDRHLYDAGAPVRCAVANLRAGGGNDDAAAIDKVAEFARRSQRRTRILVMVSDGSPSHCSVTTLTAVVQKLVREGMVCVQVGVAPLPSHSFPEFVLIDQGTLVHAAGRFATLIARLVART